MICHPFSFGKCGDRIPGKGAESPLEDEALTRAGTRACPYIFHLGALDPGIFSRVDIGAGR